MSDSDEIIGGCLILLLAVGAIVLSTIYSGFVLSILWGWFMVTAFALPALTTSKAIGVAIVVRFLTYTYTKSNSDSESGKAVAIALLIPFLVPTFALITGYIVTLFM